MVEIVVVSNEAQDSKSGEDIEQGNGEVDEAVWARLGHTMMLHVVNIRLQSEGRR